MNMLPLDRPSPKPRTYRRKIVPNCPPRPAPIPLTADRQRLAEQYLHLAYQLAWWFARNTCRDVPADELISEALHGLTYAAGRYDESRHVPFIAYAKMVIRHRLIQAVIKWRDNRHAQLPEWSDLTGEQWEVEDRRSLDLCNQAAALELCNRVRWALQPRWYKALRLYYGRGWTLEDIGKLQGISRQRVAQVIEKATREARRILTVGIA
jgi:RNA polymerase sigma factor (sigma-70 family)